MKIGLSTVVFLLSISSVAAAQDRALRENADVAAGVRLFESWLDEQMAYRGLPGVAVSRLPTGTRYLSSLSNFAGSRLPQCAQKLVTNAAASGTR